MKEFDLAFYLLVVYLAGIWLLSLSRFLICYLVLGVLLPIVGIPLDFMNQ